MTDVLAIGMTTEVLALGIDAATFIVIVRFGFTFARHMGEMETKIDTLWADFSRRLDAMKARRP